MACEQYTLPRICELSGVTKLLQLEYYRPDGSPISLKNAVIKYRVISLLDSSEVENRVITDITQNYCKIFIDTSNLNGNFNYIVDVELETDEKDSDKGMMIIYGS